MGEGLRETTRSPSVLCDTRSSHFHLEVRAGVCVFFTCEDTRTGGLWSAPTRAEARVSLWYELAVAGDVDPQGSSPRVFSGLSLAPLCPVSSLHDTAYH